MDAGRSNRQLGEWALAEHDAAVMLDPVPVFDPERLARYRRPPLPAGRFVEPDGSVVEYGGRWFHGGPPDDAYGRDTHPERFAGLHDVADALIAFLQAEYDVTVDDDLAHAADTAGTATGSFVRAVRVIPKREDAAPLTFVYTGYPGVFVHAGALYDAAFPFCGCDACDETVESTAEDLEQLVFAVVSGGFGEAYPYGAGRQYASARVPPDGSGWSKHTTAVDHLPDGILKGAERRLAGLPNGWQPWQA